MKKKVRNIDVEAYRNSLREDETMYDVDKEAYTRRGTLTLASLDGIDTVQKSGARYTIDDSTGEFGAVDPNGLSVSAQLHNSEYGGNGILHNPLVRKARARHDMGLTIAGAKNFYIEDDAEAETTDAEPEVESKEAVEVIHAPVTLIDEEDLEEDVEIENIPDKVKAKNMSRTVEVLDPATTKLKEQARALGAKLMDGTIYTGEGDYASALMNSFREPKGLGLNSTTDDAFRNTLFQETSSLTGRKNGTWNAYETKAGSLDVGFGHQLISSKDMHKYNAAEKADVIAKYQNMSDKDVYELARKDWAKFLAKSEATYNKQTAGNASAIPYKDLPGGAKSVLADIAFNVGTVSAFKTLIQLLSKGEWENATNQVRTTYKDKNGVKQPMKRRTESRKILLRAITNK